MMNPPPPPNFPQPGMPPMGMPPQPNQNAQDDSDLTQIEELIEAVIDEKWKDIEKNIVKIINWKDKVDQRVTQLEQNLKDIRSDYDSLQKSIVGKVGEYDKNVLNVGSQLKAMEKAFGEIMPQFTRNINELNRITQRVKDEDQ
ncbi:MAG: hypothetical protein ACMXYA_00770 [Candidatus Woesearchaeota archaeon]